MYFYAGRTAEYSRSHHKMFYKYIWWTRFFVEQTPIDCAMLFL